MGWNDIRRAIGEAGMRGLDPTGERRAVAELYRQNAEAQRRENEQRAMAARRSAMVQDALQVNRLLKNGNVDAATMLVNDRLVQLRDLGADPSDTQRVADMLYNGDINNAIAATDAVVEMGYQAGLLEAPAGQGMPKWGSVQTGSDGQRYGIDENNPAAGYQRITAPEGVSFSEQDAGMTEYQRRQTELREADQALQREKEERAARELPPDLLKYQIEQDGAYQTAAAASQSAYQLADQYEASVKTSGAAAKFDEFVKGVFGAEDGVTALRTEYRKLRNSLVLGDLPPGVASDKDIQIAMSGYPSDTANPEYIASFLRGMGKLNRFRAAQALYNKNYLSTNRKIDQKDRFWKAPIKTTHVDEEGKPIKTSFAEIYWSALEADIPVGEALKILGVDDPNILSKVGY